MYIQFAYKRMIIYFQNIIHATYLLCLTISLNSLSLNDALGIY